MSSRIRSGGMCIVAMLVLWLMVSASASARQFKISGKTFTGTESITITILSANLIFKSFLPGHVEPVEVTCKAIAVPGGKIFANFKFSDEKLVFSSCAITKPAACKLVNAAGEVVTVIETVGVSGEVQEEGSPTKLFFRFKPTTLTEEKEFFTNIRIGQCAGEGIFKVIGSGRCELTATTEVVLNGCNFTATSGSSFKLGKETAELLGLVGLTLTGVNKGLVWSFN
jgi:hypothetical protein